MSIRQAAFLVCLFATGTGLRVWQLGTIPSPAGDEGNWSLLALRISEGQPAVLAAEARFVPNTFGHMLAWSITLFGASYQSVRLIPAIGCILGTAIVFALSCYFRVTRFGIVVAMFMLLHPWSVMWSRIVFGPYALSLTLAVLGPVCWLGALQLDGKWRRMAALIGAGQILVLGLHFQPLAAISLVTCGIWTLFCGRSVLKSPGPWLALVLMSMHAWPLITRSWECAKILPPTHFETPFWLKLLRYLAESLDIITGEATVRHFTNVPLQGWFLNLARGLGMAGLTLAVFFLVRRTARCPATRALEYPQNLRKLALLNGLLAIIGLPVFLNFGRDWTLTYIDNDRYGFLLLASTFMLAGSVATRYASSTWPFLLMVLLFGLIPTSRIVMAFSQGGGSSLGYINFEGGGWNIWKVAQGPTSIPEILMGVAERETREEPAVLVIGDFSIESNPLEFLVEAKGRHDIRVVHGFLSSEGRYHSAFRPKCRVLLMLWSDSVYSPDFEPRAFRQINSAARQYFHNNFKDVELLGPAVCQPDGTPLLEIWAGRVPEFTK